MNRRATLIHNAHAAGRLRLSTGRIIELLGEAGYDAEYVPTESEADLTAALQDPGDLVVAAGGDGTIRGVALALAALGSSVPLALAPLGTANNIARTLGLTDSTETLLRGLADPQPRPFDLGLIRAPWGEARFLEAFGVGLFAEGLRQYSPDERKSLVRMAHAAIETLTQAEAREWQCDLDGRDLSGRYLLLEVMNTQAMGLRLRLAPDANPSDGLFDVVRVSEDDAVGFGAYLTKLVEGDLETLPNVEIVRGKQLNLRWNGLPLHFDEEVRGDDPAREPGGELELTMQAGALTLWLPKLPEAS